MSNARTFRAPKDDLVRAVFNVGVEVRADDEGVAKPKMLVGHFAVFNQWTEINSWEGRFLETLSPGAFTKTIRENRANIKVLYDHGYDPQLGNKPLGPIRELKEDGEGCYYEVELLDTNYNRDFIIPAASEPGLLGASFRFRVIRDEWNDAPKMSAENPHGIPERTIKEVKLMEFGPVTFPAYAAATAGVRGRQEFGLWHDLDTDQRAEFAEFLVRARFDKAEVAQGGIVDNPDVLAEAEGAEGFIPTERDDRPQIHINVSSTTTANEIAESVRLALTSATTAGYITTSTTNANPPAESLETPPVEAEDLRTSDDEAVVETQSDATKDNDEARTDAATSNTDDAPAEQPPVERQKTTHSERQRQLRARVIRGDI